MELDLNLSALSLFIIFLIFIITLFLHNKSHSRTPSPQSYPLIGNLIGLIENRHRFHDWVTDMLSTTPSLTLQVTGFLHLSHGICTADPTNVQHLLRSNFTNFIKGDRFYSVLHDLLGDGIFNVDGHLWSSQRKIASYEFNTRSLKNFFSDTVKLQITNSLIPRLEAACDAGEMIDFQQVLGYFTFDNICSVAFGVDSEDLVGKSMFVEAFDYAVERCSERFLVPVQMVWKIMRYFNIGSERKYREAVKVIDEFAMNLIKLKEEKWELNEGDKDYSNEDLLSRFMGSTLDFGFGDQDEKRKFLRDIVISFVLAGKDSTATALTWFFWLMSGHPRCKHLIYEELSSAVPESENWLENFKYEEMKKSHYLQAALSETLRLFPPVPINSRLTVREDVLPDGTRVGKGWFADYSAYAMGRMERLWGPDCREYKPERWIDGDGIYQPVDQFKFPVFHCGPRMCLGKEMASVQMKVIAGAVMNMFEVEVVDGGGCASRMNDAPYTLSLLLKMKGGLNVRLKRREQEK